MSPRSCRSAVAALLLALHAAPAKAMPDLSTRRVVGELAVYADDQRAELFYVAPAPLRLVVSDDGRPDFSFVQMRYTGNAVSRDRGLSLHRSLVTLRVELPQHSAEALASAARALAVAGRPAELRPLPIRRIETAMIYTSIGAAADTAARSLAGGGFQTSRDREGPLESGYWSERVFTVGLDSLTAQALHAALAHGQLMMSLGYAVIADGRLAREPWGDVDGPPALAAVLGRQLGGAPGAAAADSLRRRVVAASVIPVRVDLARWPDLVRRVDLDAGSRTGYGALEVYCYDFRDLRRPDLYEKQVEVEAESVAGRPVRLQAAFARAHPDVYRTSLRFPVAVRLDRPYRYRVAEVRPDGSTTQGDWRAGRDWLGLLDLTTPAPTTAPGVRSIR